MEVKFLCNVDLSGNQIDEVKKVSADTITAKKANLPVVDLASVDTDSPSGIIAFDMNGNTYAEDNLISGITYRGDDLSIKNSRDIYFYTHGSSDPVLVISDLNSRFTGYITCGVNGTDGAMSVLDKEGNEATCINAEGDSWIGGNLTVHGDLGAEKIKEVKSIELSGVGDIYGTALNISVDSAVSINGGLNLNRGIVVFSNDREKVNISSDGASFNVPIFLSAGFSWAGERYGIYGGGNSAPGIFAGQIFADQILINGNEAATKTYVDEQKIKRCVYNFNGDGTSKSFSVEHKLGTTNLVATLYDADTNEVVYGNVQHTSVDNTRVTFSSAPANGRPFKLVLIG